MEVWELNNIPQVSILLRTWWPRKRMRDGTSAAAELQRLGHVMQWSSTTVSEWNYEANEALRSKARETESPLSYFVRFQKIKSAKWITSSLNIWTSHHLQVDYPRAPRAPSVFQTLLETDYTLAKICGQFSAHSVFLLQVYARKINYISFEEIFLKVKFFWFKNLNPRVSDTREPYILKKCYCLRRLDIAVALTTTTWGEAIRFYVFVFCHVFLSLCALTVQC